MRYRSLLLVVALGCIGLAALWRHSVQTPASSERSAAWTKVTNSTERVAFANRPPRTDTLSESRALHHIERLYRLQADLMRARSHGEDARVASVLHTAIGELDMLVRRPGLVQDPRFRQAFHSLTREYESHYGLPDTLRLPQGKIYELRDGLSASIDRRESQESIVDVLPSDLREQDLPVPLPMNRPVRKTISFLLQHKERYLYPWLRRASTYFPMIEQIFAEEGVPDELKYLAIAESGLNPHAQSRAQAAGIWQFVAETGRRYGLSVDPWVDERLDPEKSTRAAAKHLKDLHARFGDWQLALAGYNCNPGVVQYHIHRYRERTGRSPSFWDIYNELPDETRNYVPLFTATAIIISNPVAFDLKRVQPGPRYAFDYVPVDAPLPLDRVAKLAGTDLSKVRALNPELRSDRLPPSSEPYYVRLPYGTYSTFSSNYAAMPKEERKMTIQHVVQPGETAGRIAERYHVQRGALLSQNDVRVPFGMKVGQRIEIPEKPYAGNSRIADSTGGTPIRVQYGRRTIRPVGGEANSANLTAALTPHSPSTP